jgi:hypothetical protein
MTPDGAGLAGLGGLAGSVISMRCTGTMRCNGAMRSTRSIWSANFIGFVRSVRFMWLMGATASSGQRASGQEVCCS